MYSVFKITPTTQKYDWGKVGRQSAVAQLAESGNHDGFTLDPAASYAELWMGTHPTAPSHLASTNEQLSTYLAKHPDLIGQKIREKFASAGAEDGNLPFLFKVLSIEKALSIQTHPDLETAKKLHAEQPDVYKDPNHKPEMALALTSFQALCGFLPLPLIATHLQNVPEFASLVPSAIVDAFLAIASSETPTAQTEKVALKNLFAGVMTAEPEMVKCKLGELVERLTAKQGSSGEGDQTQNVAEVERTGLSEIDSLILRLNTQFPGDVGIFCAFLLNYITLQPGEAIFLGAGEPHAYIYGDCMECMANSDNVIRAGLTPKLRDIPNLVSGLTYIAAPPEVHVVKPAPFGGEGPSAGSTTTLYDPPIPEFSVLRTVFSKDEKTARHRAIDGPSILILVKGRATVSWDGNGNESAERGDVFFVGAGTEVALDPKGEDEVEVYRAFVESEH
ncbi:mannose-6-phosphate isomerase [Pterulicium gracile]|uniref:Mannose-6-phosphate isomerase n=1 Tax=Pterulicium gracile TaxID=1884261 RepID=A0A5C3QJ10_9AGAR|nr:mannose-6-phosphate isomerase [Pterula gracilis]